MRRVPTPAPSSPTARVFRSFLGAVLIVAAALAPMQATAAPGLRVMLHPDAAPRGELPPERLAKLEAVAGTKLTLLGVTRTGGLDLAVEGNPDAATLAALAGRLRGERAVLWAEPSRPAPTLRRAAKASGGAPGRQLLVRLADGVAADFRRPPPGRRRSSAGQSDATPSASRTSSWRPGAPPLALAARRSVGSRPGRLGPQHRTLAAQAPGKRGQRRCVGVAFDGEVEAAGPRHAEERQFRTGHGLASPVAPAAARRAVRHRGAASRAGRAPRSPASA